MNARKRRRVAFGIAVAIVAVVGIVHWYRTGLQATGAPEAVVVVKEGETPDVIAEKLKAEGLIRSERAFTLHVKFEGLATDIKSGRFRLSGEQSGQEIAQALTEESQLATQFTIPEGLTQAETAERLDRLEITDADAFEALKATNFPEYDFLRTLPDDATLEGYLFPETYAIPLPGTSAEDVARIMLDQFRTELTGFQNQVANSGRSLHEVVTIASLVEEEVRTTEDRKTVAGIIFRRLEEDIRLGIDATVRYALDKPSDALTIDDLATDDPYNTRRFKGLPPGPIANPSLDAILAVLDPTDSPYLFYLSAPDGTTYYAETNDEHEANKAEHLQ
ncbi:MAG: endolytic transglycosylase MltG [bacterium]|nr:endolytic transglycosylase MltG [bacterium]